jgi:hypothetical protein
MLNAVAFVDPHSRLRTIVSRAVEGCLYESSTREEGGGRLVIIARRTNGAKVHLRLLGVQDSESTALPETGSRLHLAGVSSQRGTWFWKLFLPNVFHHHSTGEARVRIKAGTALMEIVCQDAEWWEDPSGAQTRAEPN